MKKRTKNVIKGILIPIAVIGLSWISYSSVMEKLSPVAQLMIPMMMF